jgi:branched-chain amino acid transport system permease protein
MVIGFDVVVQSIMGGLLIGCVYALVAIGFTILLGVVRYTNFAHGQLVMAAMFFSFTGLVTLKMNPLAVAVLSVLACSLLAAATYAGLGRFAVQRPEGTQVVATIGLLLIFQSGATLLYGPTARAGTTSYSNDVYSAFGIRISQPGTWAAFVSVVAVGVLMFFLHRTDFGRAMRATAENQMAAKLMGINTRRVYLAALVLAGTLEGLAGALMAPISVVSPFTGFSFILKAFVIVVIAGLGRVGGALVVGIALGIVEALTNLYIGSELATAVVFIILIAALLFRPQGILGGARAELV